MDGVEYRFNAQHADFAEHERQAIEWGGQVASITNREELEHVRLLANNQTVLIGARRQGVGNGPDAEHWNWADGEPWGYTNWAPDEPNNAGGNEDRVQMYGNGKWNDVAGWWSGPAVYKRVTTRARDP